MALVKDEVLVLKSISFSEADKIITVFGLNRGKYAVIAKGIRKIKSKNRGNMEVMSLTKLSYYEGRNLGTLREAEAEYIADFNLKILGHMQKIVFLLYNLMPEDQQDIFVFESIKKLYLSELSMRDINKFRVKILRYLGYLPDLNSCGICNLQKELQYLDTSNFHLICDSCFHKASYIEKRLLEPVSSVRYESTKMTSAIDDYVKKIIEA